MPHRTLPWAKRHWRRVFWAPASPDNLVLAADGLSVTGTADAGSTSQGVWPQRRIAGQQPGRQRRYLSRSTWAVHRPMARVLQVSATGTDGAVSLPATTPGTGHHGTWQPLTNLVLSNDGLVLSGRGEAGCATVTVLGERYRAGCRMVDASGNTSASTWAPHDQRRTAQRQPVRCGRQRVQRRQPDRP